MALSDFLNNLGIPLVGPAIGLGESIGGVPNLDPFTGLEDFVKTEQQVAHDLEQLPGEMSTVIHDVNTFFGWIAHLFHPFNLLRAVEFITGLALMMYGLHTLLGVARRSSATHRTSIIKSAIASFVKKKPTHIEKATESGKRQGERDVAYRRARHEARRAGLSTE